MASSVDATSSSDYTTTTEGVVVIIPLPVIPGQPPVPPPEVPTPPAVGAPPEAPTETEVTSLTTTTTTSSSSSSSCTEVLVTDIVVSCPASVPGSPPPSCATSPEPVKTLDCEKSRDATTTTTSDAACSWAPAGSTEVDEGFTWPECSSIQGSPDQSPSVWCYCDRVGPFPTLADVEDEEENCWYTAMPTSTMSITPAPPGPTDGSDCTMSSGVVTLPDSSEASTTLCGCGDAIAQVNTYTNPDGDVFLTCAVDAHPTVSTVWEQSATTKCNVPVATGMLEGGEGPKPLDPEVLRAAADAFCNTDTVVAQPGIEGSGSITFYIDSGVTDTFTGLPAVCYGLTFASGGLPDPNPQCRADSSSGRCTEANGEHANANGMLTLWVREAPDQEGCPELSDYTVPKGTECTSIFDRMTDKCPETIGDGGASVLKISTKNGCFDFWAIGRYC